MARLLCAAAFLLAFLIPGGSAAGQTLARSLSSTGQSQALQVELTNTIRAKNAKVGDVVKARTVTALILADRTVVPEGSRLVGRVVRVSFQPNGSQDTALAIAFDELQTKPGRTVRANFSIRAGALPEVLVHQAADEEDEQIPEPPPNSPRPAATAPARMPFSRPEKPTYGSPLQPLPQIYDNRRDLRSAPGGTLTGMPGVTLRVDGPAGAATFQSSNRKLELKSGLQLVLRVDPQTDSPQQR
jgi:hypothetical protein